jgi:pyruvate/2-oxoglutarate dehydrogenase complex dihydrolipoamide dehydrogenase (E3) component
VSLTDHQRLLSHVHPPGWRNPAPQSLYDLVVIGGGTAGLVCAAGAAGLGARVALIERGRLGGDCLNTGCIPSKALLRSARVVGEAHAGGGVGVAAEAHVDFAAVMVRLRARRADIAPHDSAARLAALGVDVFFGQASFSGRSSIRVDQSLAHPGDAPRDPASHRPIELAFRRAVIATGSRPATPAIAGLADVPFFTNETIFDLQEQPPDLIVLGGGPIGCELSQAFARLGTRVTLIEHSPQVLPREDEDAAATVAAALVSDRVEIRLRTRVTSVQRDPRGVRIVADSGEAVASQLLVATGRAPNLDALELSAAGVAADADGVRVSDRMRTTNHRIYASGDVASKYKFTHAADALSRIVLQNALFFGRKSASALVVPWCTFTDPEVAHVGIHQRDAVAGTATITIPLRQVDRAIVDDEVEGFVRIHHRRGRIAGATIVAPAAGEMIGSIAYAMQNGHTLDRLSAIIFPYPTRSLALRQAGDAYRRTKLTPRARTVLEYYFRLGRRSR